MNLFKTENYDHEHYKIVEDCKDADAEAWVFVNSSKFVKVPFKFEELKPNEIRAQVLYTGLCHSDSSTGRGQWGKTNYPICVGHEIIGQVEKIGSQVKDFKIGEKVGFGVNRANCKECKFCQKGREVLCTGLEMPEKQTYGNYWGGWATHLQHPAEFFFKLPEGTDLKKAGTSFCAASTMFGPIKKFGKEGDRVLVIGIGGLGHLAVMILSKMGYNVSALTHDKEKQEEILKFGAKRVILLDDKEKIASLEGKFDFILNTQPTFKYVEESLKFCAPECRYVMLGVAPEDETLNVTSTNWIFKDVLLIGSVNGSRKLSEECLQWQIDNNCWPEIEEIGFDDFDKALKKLENEDAFYRIIVNVEDYSRNHGWIK